MTETIMPAFNRCPQEASIIGRLLAGYGELEFDMASCLTCFTPNTEAAFKVLFKMRSPSARIDVADALLRPALAELDMAAQFEEALSATKHCLRIRNQYAHCHWADRQPGALSFARLETAVSKEPMGDIEFRAVSLSLLEAQETYFVYAHRIWFFLAGETELLQGKINAHPWTMPPKLPPPPPHNQ